ncbi:retron Ec67 family RNA-directed DNA polymerase/endonuclease [Sideroxydans sp. CL21]|uniref:retron Ec67 family RNA-directed DNA polymerase/endonuclease n=1 Tax=Sideroxydans sp. CL21 TaxID=2600596 RepID=UPI0024BC5333|nr:retron Ec67 family RNA-directed DNA polymerase/endonuclease [Sideroxydans sp. CL21]
MTQLIKLKSAKNLHDVAALIGFKASALSFILYKKNDATKYKQFDIPKRHGGTRNISAPVPELKLIQRRLSDLLQNCVEEINKANGSRDRISHGFKRKRSIITNAKEHRNRKYVFNVDLTDFFGSINFGRVRGFFMKDKNFLLHADVATVLAQIVCHKNALPQGSPCSPVISNVIGHVLDIHLVRLAARHGCTYSRYADDLTFSTNKPEFPACIAQCDSGDKHKWSPGSELATLIKKSGFAINPIKTRMQYRDSRQEVTGLIVNKKVNVRSEYRRTVRAMVHHLFTKGSFDFVHKVVDEKGAMIINKVAGSANQLHGMLGFIDGVDLYNEKLNPQNKDSKDQFSATTKESMYRRFLLFKEFYTAQTPVIICEGKTDNVYILHAIRSLAATHPRLATTNADGVIKLAVRIFKYSGTSTGRILGVNGGVSGLSHFMRLYDREHKKFKVPGAQQPVILLADNDAGAKGKGGIFNTVKGITKAVVAGTEPFVHITGNLYLVATPLKSGEKESVIEDFFDDAIKSTIVGKKTFSLKDDFDSDAHYGKHVFAQKVVRVHADKINFSGFNPILFNIEMVINAHTKNHLVISQTP